MRRRLIIASTLLLIILSFAIITYNVYASLNQAFSVRNTIRFRPDGEIYVDLNCRVKNCVQSDLTEPPTGYPTLEEYWNDIGLVHKVEYSEEMLSSGTQQNLQSAENSWNITESLVFKNYDQAIIYSIDVKNYTGQAIIVEFKPTNATNPAVINICDKKLILKAFEPGKEPDTGTIEIITSVLDNSRTFKNEQNNFDIIFKIYEE